MRRRSTISTLSGYQKRTVHTYLSQALSKYKSLSSNTLSSQCQGPDSLKRSSTTLVEDDDFSELGAPVIKNGFSSLKLMTEKPSSLKAKKPYPKKDMSPTKSISVPEEGITDSLSTLREHPTSVGLSAVVEANSEVRKLSTAEDCDFSEMGAPVIKNEVSLVKLMSEKPNLYLVDKPGPTKDMSPTKLVPAEGISEILSGIELPICPWSMPHLPVAFHGRLQNVTLRILGLSHETSVDMIHSFLKSVGCLEEIAIKQWGIVHAVFRVKADSDLKDVLNKLNGAIIDKRQIKAEIIHSHDNAAAAPVSHSNRKKMGLQVSSHLEELHNQLNLRALYAEDLYNLHLAIMHLESHSGTSIHDSS